MVFLWGSTLIGKALNDILSTLGLMAAIFYLLTAGTAVWYYRRTILASTGNFILGGMAVFGIVLSVISKSVGRSSFYNEPMASHEETAAARTS